VGVCGSMMTACVVCVCMCGAEVRGSRVIWSGVNASVDAWAVGVLVCVCVLRTVVLDVCGVVCVVWCVRQLE
jgi:hypothetical protein